MEQPLLFFVHIPKAAGSTMNTMLETLGPGRAHVDTLSGKSSWRAASRHAVWLSGHMSKAQAERRLARAGVRREVRCFTLVRDPKQQLISHYNWLVEIRTRGSSFFDSHSKMLRTISDEIVTTGFDDPVKVRDLLIRRARAFSNIQSSLILGARVDIPDSEAALHQVLDTFVDFGTEVETRRVFESVSGRPAPDVGVRNSSPYHFDPDIFDSDELRDFLAFYLWRDQMLYDWVRERSRTHFSQTNG